MNEVHGWPLWARGIARTFATLARSWAVGYVVGSLATITRHLSLDRLASRDGSTNPFLRRDIRETRSSVVDGRLIRLGRHMEFTAADIGSRIRLAREQRALTLRDIASVTKISMTALDAIEHNDFARLPGGVFRRAYVRTFASEVGLNGDELAREYRARFETDVPSASLPLHEANGDERARAVRWVAAVSSAVIGLLIGGWLISKAAQSLEGPPPEALARKAVEADSPAHARPMGADILKDVAVAAAAVEDAGEPSLRLAIRTTGPCWVSAVADGERVVYRLMQPGERTLVEAHDAITLRVGDAGTVAYSIDGAAGRPLGRSGEAITVRITTDNLESLYADSSSTIPG